MSDELNDAVTEKPSTAPESAEATTQQEPAEMKSSQSSMELNLSSLMDVQVTLSVEIGRTKLPIKQLLSLNQGSVVELDRQFNEPLDLMVNGMLIARGEVVVVDDQFGLRLIDIVSQPERLKNLK